MGISDLRMHVHTHLLSYTHARTYEHTHIHTYAHTQKKQYFRNTLQLVTPDLPYSFVLMDNPHYI